MSHEIRTPMNGILDLSKIEAGIPEEKLALILHPFEQVETGYTKKIEGTGLGLTIVNKLTVMMHGEFCLVSHPGEGTRASFTLPLERLAKPLGEVEAAPAKEGAQVFTDMSRADCR